MILLGINDGHDASAALIIDGKIIGAVQEERIVRKKNVSSFPINSIKYLLKTYKINPKDIEQVCVANKNLQPLQLWNIYADFSINDWHNFQNFYKNKIYFNKKQKLHDFFKGYKPKYKLGYSLKGIPFSVDFNKNSKILDKIQKLRIDTISKYLRVSSNKISFFDHHDCHAYYGYYTNVFKNKNQNIVTCDAGGDGKYASIINVKNYKFKKILRSNKNLIGVIYRNITLMLNMNPSRHIYKVMGLAPYTSPKYYQQILSFLNRSLKLNNLDFKINKEMKDRFFYFKKYLATERFDNVAGATQQFCEDALMSWFKNIYKKTKCKSFVFSGGVANNVKANLSLSELSFIKNLWIPPGPGDESLSIGATYNYIKNKIGERKAYKFIEVPKDAYWGPNINSKQIEEFSNNKLIKKYYKKSIDKSFTKVAKSISKGNVVFLCLSSQEFGQRALGHRSIVCDPSNPEAVTKINSTIKMRDFWMPFTPSILDTDIDRYCKKNSKIDKSLMTICLNSTELGRKHLKAAMHPYDFTIRPQVVKKTTCEKYYKIISNFKKITGIGGLLNTSLNMHEFPIVTQPMDIIKEIIKKNENPNFDILVGNYFFELRKN